MDARKSQPSRMSTRPSVTRDGHANKVSGDFSVLALLDGVTVPILPCKSCTVPVVYSGEVQVSQVAHVPQRQLRLFLPGFLRMVSFHCHICSLSFFYTIAPILSEWPAVQASSFSWYIHVCTQPTSPANILVSRDTLLLVSNAINPGP